MVVSDVARACDGILEIGVAALVFAVETERLGRSDVAGTVEHVNGLVFRLEAEIAVVGDMKLCAAASLGFHLDDAGGTTRTVLCGLGGVL